MKKFLTIIGILCFGVGSILAQNVQVSGIVTGADDGQPLPGVSVSVKGTIQGTVTDIYGKYSISVPADGALVFSFVGMASQEIAVAGRQIINVELHISARDMDEVVVTGYDMSRGKKTLGFSAPSFKGDELVNAKTVNPLQALQGKVAGVEISSSQQIGGTQNISIRGYSSFGNNQPLIIVDGIPMTNTQNQVGTINSQSDFGSGLNALNSSDIAELTFLKGSAASALYGSRAAQGVIMITTKSGKNTQGKVNVDYDGSVSIDRIGRLAFEQTMFGQGWSMDRALDENGNWGAAFDGKERPWGNIVGDEQLMIPNTYKKNRIRDFYDFGMGYNNSLSFSGGTDRSTFRASLSHSYVDGPIPTDFDSYNRFTIGVNASHKANNRLTVSTAFNTSVERNKVAPTGQDNSLFRSLYEISTGLSIVDLKDLNSKFNQMDNYFTPYGLNPYSVIDWREAKQNKQKFFGKFQVDWEILTNLKATYRFGGDFETAKIKQHFDALRYSNGSNNTGQTNQGSYSQQKIDRVQLNHDVLLNYSNRFEDFSLNALAGLNVNERSVSSLFGSISSIYIPGFYHLSNSLSPATSSESTTVNRLWGVFLNVDLGFRDYLYLTLTARNDKSSTLPKNNNSYFYPSAMMSFVVSDFLKQNSIDVGVLDFAKLRLAYGQTGKDAAAYAVYDRLASAAVTNPGFPYVSNLTFPLGGINSYTISNVAGNLELKPELTNEFEIGADLSLFGDRVGLDISYYNKFTKGLIAGKPLDPATGFTSFGQTNLGDVRNSGVELLLTVSPVKTKDFSWEISYNFTKNKNKIERLEADETFLSGYGGMGMYAVEGKPMGQYKCPVAYKVEVDGVTKTVVDGNGMTRPTSLEQFLDKDINEKFRMGLTNTFTYKGISLSGTLDLRYGGHIYCYTKDYAGWVGNGPETAYNDRKPFIIPNSVFEVSEGKYIENTTPIDPTTWHNFYSNGGFKFSDDNIIDRSFLKLRNISLSYVVPAELSKKIRVDKIRVSVTASNILLWTPTENMYIDPEVTTFGNNISAKFGEFASTPPCEYYVFGLSFSF